MLQRNNTRKKERHILLVEDDHSLALWISGYLQSKEYFVTTINSGDEAIDFIGSQSPDLVILDVGLPVIDGFQVCKAVRKFYSNPIIMLTAKTSENDEVTGLESGADDYVSKPVRAKALLARIHRLLQPVLKNNGIKIDPQNRSLIIDGAAINISSHEFDLLNLLIKNQGKIVSREKLISELRGFEYDGFDRSVDIKISRLRKKLDDSSSNPHLIKTIWGKGYLYTGERKVSEGFSHKLSASGISSYNWIGLGV